MTVFIFSFLTYPRKVYDLLHFLVVCGDGLETVADTGALAVPRYPHLVQLSSLAITYMAIDCDSCGQVQYQQT